MTSERVLRAGLVGLFLSLPLTNTLTLDVGFPLTIAHAFVALLAATLVWRIRASAGRESWLPATLFFAFCAVYLLAFVINIGSSVESFSWATGRNAPGIRSAVKVIWLIGNVVSAVVIANSIRQAHAERPAIRALVAGGIASSIYGMFQVVGQSHGFFIPLLPGTEFIEGTSSFWIIPRAKSTFLEPSFFGAFVAAVLPFAIVAFHGRWRSILSCAAILAGILVTFSIAGWLSAAVGIGVFLVISAKQEGGAAFGRLAVASLAALVVVYGLVPGLPQAALALVDKGSIASASVLVLPGTSPSPIASRAPNAEQPEVAERSAAERIATTQAAIRMFASSPVIGVGPGNFGFRYSEFRSQGTAIPDQLLIANNVYAELLAETGVLGLATYVAGFIGLMGLGLRARLRAVGFQAAALGAGIASMAAIATAYLTGPSFTILYQWAIVGLVAALVVWQREEPETL